MAIPNETANTRSLRQYVMDRRKAQEEQGITPSEQEYYFTDYPQVPDEPNKWGVPEEDIYRFPAAPVEPELGTLKTFEQDAEAIPGKPPLGYGVDLGTVEEFAQSIHSNLNLFPYGNPTEMNPVKILNDEWAEDEKREFEKWSGGEVIFEDVDKLDPKSRAAWDARKLRRRAELKSLIESTQKSDEVRSKNMLARFNAQKAENDAIRERVKEKAARSKQAELFEKRNKLVVEIAKSGETPTNTALLSVYDTQIAALNPDLPKDQQFFGEDEAKMPTDSELADIVRGGTAKDATDLLKIKGLSIEAAREKMLGVYKLLGTDEKFKVAKKAPKVKAKQIPAPKVAAEMPEARVKIPEKPPKEVLGRSSFTKGPTKDEQIKALQDIIEFPKKIGLGTANWRAAVKLLADISGFTYNELLAKPWQEIIRLATTAQKKARKQGI